MNQEIIKLIAVLCMVPNHIAYALMTKGTVPFEIMTAIGCYTCVTMCWFLVEGFHKTSNPKAYAKRLAIAGVISQVPFMLALYSPATGFLGFRLNIMFNFALGILLLTVVETWPESMKKQLAIVGLIFLSAFCDWSCVVPVYILLFRKAQADPKYAPTAWNNAALICLVFTFMETGMYMPMVPALVASSLGLIVQFIAGIVIRKFYNGERNTANPMFTKWFFYGFYPVHLLIIGIIRIMMR